MPSPIHGIPAMRSFRAALLDAPFPFLPSVHVAHLYDGEASICFVFPLVLMGRNVNNRQRKRKRIGASALVGMDIRE